MHGTGRWGGMVARARLLRAGGARRGGARGGAGGAGGGGAPRSSPLHARPSYDKARKSPNLSTGERDARCGARGQWRALSACASGDRDRRGSACARPRRPTRCTPSPRRAHPPVRARTARAGTRVSARAHARASRGARRAPGGGALGRRIVGTPDRKARLHADAAGRRGARQRRWDGARRCHHAHWRKPLCRSRGLQP